MIDLDKQREAFEDGYANHLVERDDSGFYINDGIQNSWEKHLLKAEIEALKAQQKLNKPARIGGTVFREGVAWETVIECAQRHYDYGQCDTQPTPLISPSDAIKLASGELVLVPKEPTEDMIKHAYGTYEGATILPYSFYKSMIEAAQENSHE